MKNNVQLLAKRICSICVGTFFFLFSIILSGCAKQEVKKSPQFPVSIGTVTVEDIPKYIKGVGRLVPSLEAAIKAQVSGILTNVLFIDGQLVEEGDLLMTIDPRIYETRVQEAIAQLAEDKARLKYALEFAQTYGTLVSKDYVSRLDYEQAIRNVDAYKAAVELDIAAVKQAEVNLGFTQLRAPFKGYLSLRAYDPGNYVDSALGQALVMLRKVTPLSIKFYVSGEFVQEIREKQQESALYLEADLPNDPRHPLQGTLWFIDNTVNAETGMILLQGIIPNEDERGWPGAFTRVRLRLKTLANAVLVPKEAIIVGENGNFVFVLNEENMTVDMRMIGKDFEYQDSIVVQWGLQRGEKVITDGQLNLYNGAQVYLGNKDKKV